MLCIPSAGFAKLDTASALVMLMTSGMTSFCLNVGAKKPAEQTSRRGRAVQHDIPISNWGSFNHGR